MVALAHIRNGVDTHTLAAGWRGGRGDIQFGTVEGKAIQVQGCRHAGGHGQAGVAAFGGDVKTRFVRVAGEKVFFAVRGEKRSAAALSDPAWNMNLLQHAGQFLDWISIHEYWDMMTEVQNPATYEQCMAFTDQIDHSVREVRGMLAALRLEGRIKIAFDEWNLRSWHHPNVHTIRQGIGKESYIIPRDRNDDNTLYTMADAVFSACFLNAMNRHCDVVGMANFAPVVNTRGCIYSYDKGIVLRSTYHVFDLYVNRLGDTVIDLWAGGNMPVMTVPHKSGGERTVDCLDLLATTFPDREGMAVAAVNKDPVQSHSITLPLDKPSRIMLLTLNGGSKDAYNDVGHNGVQIAERQFGPCSNACEIELPAHSVNIISIG